MGKKSTKEDKSIYQICREEAGLTRAEASEAMSFVSESRIEKFESGKSPVQPEEVLAMAKAYKKPSLCNYYCSHQCPIGNVFVPEVKMKDLAQMRMGRSQMTSCRILRKSRLGLTRSAWRRTHCLCGSGIPSLQVRLMEKSLRRPEQQ